MVNKSCAINNYKIFENHYEVVQNLESYIYFYNYKKDSFSNWVYDTHSKDGWIGKSGLKCVQISFED